jgi:hypothetical protein
MGIKEKIIAFIDNIYLSLRRNQVLLLIIKNQEKIMADLTKLQASADANKTAVAALIAYIGTLSAADQPAVDAIQAEVDASTASLNGIIPAAPVAPAPAAPSA